MVGSCGILWRVMFMVVEAEDVDRTGRDT